MIALLLNNFLEVLSKIEFINIIFGNTLLNFLAKNNFELN